MTKKEIVKQISERAKLPQLKTKQIVQWTFDAIIDTLSEEGRIELRNFGVFEVKRRNPRKARNPRTGTEVEVEAKNVVTFQPGKVMEDRVKRMTNAPETKKRTRKSRRADPEAELVGATATINGHEHLNHDVDGAAPSNPKPKPR